MNKTIADLETKGLVRIDYPAKLRLAVESAVTNWKEFCAVDEKVKTSFPYFDVEGVGVGYELKKTPGSTLDLKEDFHYTQISSSDLDDEAATLKHEAIDNFLRSASSLVDLMRPLVLDAAQQMQEAYNMPGLTDEVADGEVSSWVVRFLHYFGGSQTGEEIAKAHADKSGFTLHLYESDPGLQYLDRAYEWQDMTVSEGETVIIPGMRGQYRSGNRLKATFHRVIATPKTAVAGRFSVVCFIHLKHTPAYDKARAGRLQEFEPGFNYEMSFEEFAKLFAK